MVDSREPIVKVIGGIVILAVIDYSPLAREEMGRLFMVQLSIGIILPKSKVPFLRL